MKNTLAAGLERLERILVDEPRTIAFLGEGLRTYATPAMVSDVEYACLALIGEHLEAGESSVGVRVAIDHLGATPLGHVVEVRVAVVEVDGRRVRLAAEVSDGVEVVGRGEHARFVIDVERHRARLADKARRLADPR